MPTLLDRLNRRYGRWGVPHVTALLVLGQVAAFVLFWGRPGLVDKIALKPDRVLDGEVWRLVTFLFDPPLGNPICAFFAWYLLFLMGTALEHSWGDFRYNVYLLIGYLATVIAAFVSPRAPGTNGYMLASVFLAFATLFPNFEICIFFLLPVKVKWLALITWIFYAVPFLEGDWEGAALVVAAVCNYLLFFGRDIWIRVRDNKWHMESTWRRQTLGTPSRIIHTCRVCGATQDSHPQLEFRYCSKCHGNHAYCDQHLRSHEHIAAQDVPV